MFVGGAILRLREASDSDCVFELWSLQRIRLFDTHTEVLAVFFACFFFHSRLSEVFRKLGKWPGMTEGSGLGVVGVGG